MIRFKRLRCLALAASLWSAPGCDSVFQPYRESDQFVSIFGILNASGPRQWIRVTPIRHTALGSPDPLGYTVTLEHLGTGEEFELTESIDQFELPGEVQGVSAYAHNYWTDTPIEPGATYRFRASAPDGRTATADVRVPPQIPRVVVGIELNQTLGYVRFPGEHVAMMRIVQRDRVVGVGVDSLPVIMAQPTPIGDGMLEGRVQRTIDCAYIAQLREVVPYSGPVGCPSGFRLVPDIVITASGDEWPFGPEHIPWALGMPEVNSNIQNALGFIGGILSRVVPFETCVHEPVLNPYPPCELVYDENTATLLGTITDAGCTEKRLDGAVVRLTEDEATFGMRKVRTVGTNNGAYRIGGLEAGKLYRLRVTYSEPIGDPPPGRQNWFTHEEVIEFQPGEEKVLDIGLTRQCPL